MIYAVHLPWLGVIFLMKMCGSGSLCVYHERLLLNRHLFLLSVHVSCLDARLWRRRIPRRWTRYVTSPCQSIRKMCVFKLRGLNTVLLFTRVAIATSTDQLYPLYSRKQLDPFPPIIFSLFQISAVLGVLVIKWKFVARCRINILFNADIG